MSGDASEIETGETLLNPSQLLPAEAQQSGRVSATSVKPPGRLSVSADANYQQGDIVWARVQGYPWWAAMIAEDPKSGEYVTEKPGVRADVQKHYHVLFFGPTVEHNWISVKRLMEFKSKKGYDQYLNEVKQRATKSSSEKKFLKSITVKPNYQSAWDMAVKEADEALKIKNIEYRKDHWTTVFFDKAEQKKADKKQQKTPKKQLIPEDGMEPNSKNSNKRKRKIPTPNPEPEVVEEVPEPVKPDPPPVAVSKARKQKVKIPLPKNNDDSDLVALTQLPTAPVPETDPESEPNLAFRRFVQLNLRAVAYRYPTQKYCQLKTLLQRIWDSMSLEDKKQALSEPAPEVEFVPSGDESELKSKLSRAKGIEMVDIDADKPPLPAPLPAEIEEYRDALGNYQLEIYRLTNIWAVRNQPVCAICEKPGAELNADNNPINPTDQTDDDLFQCSGDCFSHYHKKCLVTMHDSFGLPPYSPSSTTVICAECASGKRTCFSCKRHDLSQNADNDSENYSEEDRELIVCSVKTCHHFFHRICAKKMRLSRFESGCFTCPQHACATCAAAVEDPTSAEASRTGRMFRCVRCPVAYHVGDFCIAAGTFVLGMGPNIVCGDHLEPTASLAMISSKSKLAVSKLINVTWCFTCGKSGPHHEDKQEQKQQAESGEEQRPPEKPLICCSTCPAAYHRRCLPAAQAVSDQQFVCIDCNSGKRPLYGDIVWVKVGYYRWWPCEIYHPENLPANIRKMKHGAGEFSVRFFGTGEFFWLGRGRCFHFQYGDTSSSGSGNGTLARSYNCSIIEARAAFDEWNRFKERQISTQRKRANCKPMPFKYIKANYPIGTVEIPRPDLSELPKCDCDKNTDSPCSSDNGCVNRLTFIECHPQVCDAGDQCCNQRFVKRLYAPVEPFRTTSRGWGLRALAPIKRGQFVVEYVGDLIDFEEHRNRVNDAKKNGETNFYFLNLDKGRIIDAGPKGNLSRFMNHSCQPSCEAQKWLVNGDLRIGLFALRDIAAGDELTFNYNCDECNEEGIFLDKQSCKCGAPDCRGLIGASKSSQQNQETKTGVKSSKGSQAKVSKRAKQIQQLTVFRDQHDDNCFHCGELGRLVLCDKVRCPKAYHVGCLGQDKPPTGKFFCPWHFCSVCWKPSTQLCAFCPHSYCAEHASPETITERMSATAGAMWCCNGHKPEELNEALGFNKDGSPLQPTEEKQAELAAAS